MLESKIERYLREGVISLDGETRKLSYIGHNGAPDRLIMLNKKIAFAELKSPGQRASRLQELEMEILRNYGQRCLLLDSIGAVDDFITSMYI